MSASLVGSEMCIRDRFQATLGEVQARLSDPSGLAPLRRAPWAHPRSALACLLYTSDAADDM
eukprot:11125216-Alexandrium_andersonii.AAC.1